MSEEATDSGAELDQPSNGSVPPEGSAPPQGSVPPPMEGESPFGDPGGSPFDTPTAEEPYVEQPAPAPAPEAKPKKRKIDLKARLSSVRGTGAIGGTGTGDRKSADPLSFPPPPVTGGLPAPKLPGISAPAISSPFAPEPEKPKQSAQQQTIKVEMGEEVEAERRKQRKKMMLYVAIAALVCLAAGFVVGGVRERGQRGFKAIEGANALAADVEAANKSMIGMSDALRDAVEKLGNEEYPDDLADVLAKTNVPFSAENFQGKGVGGLPGETLNGLLAYVGGVDDLNQQKDKLRNLLGAAKPAVAKYTEEKKNPVVNFSVLFEKQGDNVAAQLVPNKEPFKAKDKWPATYKVVIPKGKETADEEVARWEKGDLFKSGDNRVAIPMDEQTVAAFTSQKLVFQLRKAIADTKNLIDGIPSPDPRLQTDGLLKEGERLIEQLKKVGSSG